MDPRDPESPEGGLAGCSQCGFVDYGNPLPCVGFFIFDAGRVMIGRRAVEPAKGMWDILGGFIDAGETAEEAVLREAREETNLGVEIVAYLGSIPDAYGDRRSPTLNLIYLVRPNSGKMKPQSDVVELQWFSVDEIPTDLAFPHQQLAVELLRGHIHHGN